MPLSNTHPTEEALIPFQHPSLLGGAGVHDTVSTLVSVCDGGGRNNVPVTNTPRR